MRREKEEDFPPRASLYDRKISVVRERKLGEQGRAERREKEKTGKAGKSVEFIN